MTDCGHDHPANPYTDPIRARTYSRLTTDLLRLLITNIDVDMHVCGQFAALTGVSLADPLDPLPTYRALLWEVADVVNVMTAGKEPAFHTYVGCSNPEHNHDVDGLTPEQDFGDKTMQAFFAAASVGQPQAAVNVVDSIMAEYYPTGSPHMYVAAFFSNAMLSLAQTARVNRQLAPLDLFEHRDND